MESKSKYLDGIRYIRNGDSVESCRHHWKRGFIFDVKHDSMIEMSIDQAVKL